MSDVQAQVILSVIRSLLIAAGSGLVTQGYLDDTGLNALVGAAMVALPILWGALNKVNSEKKTQVRETTAVNAGLAAATPGDAPVAKVDTATAKNIIEVMRPPTDAERAAAK